MLISQAKIVNEGRIFEGDVLIKGHHIDKIAPFIAAPPRTKVVDDLRLADEHLTVSFGPEVSEVAPQGLQHRQRDNAGSFGAQRAGAK